MATNMDVDDAPAESLLRQSLLSVDEVFVYKIPPLKSSGGHRAEDWDLAHPLQTCGFQVERRGDELYLVFTTNNHSQIYAVTKYHSEPKSSVEPVLDSSRYFVTQLVQPGKPNRSIWIGFGFRQREQAIDLLGTLQSFHKSIQRELQAKQMMEATMSQNAIPTLQAGQKIHINLGSTTGSNKKKKSSILSPGPDSAIPPPTPPSTPILLKKPPPAAGATTPVIQQQQQPPQQQQVRLSMSHINIQADHDAGVAARENDSVSGAAVANSVDGFDDIEEDDEDDDWNDFQQA